MTGMTFEAKVSASSDNTWCPFVAAWLAFDRFPSFVPCARFAASAALVVAALILLLIVWGVWRFA
jgi:hypothetical protein